MHKRKYVSLELEPVSPTRSPTEHGGGSGGSLAFLKCKNPIPIFDTHYTFFEHVVVDDRERVVHLPGFNTSTGLFSEPGNDNDLEERELRDTDLPQGAVKLGHKYFYNSHVGDSLSGIENARLMDGSMTKFVHDRFPGFEKEATAQRIGCSPRILNDRFYKYYQIALEPMRELWPSICAQAEDLRDDEDDGLAPLQLRDLDYYFSVFCDDCSAECTTPEYRFFRCMHNAIAEDAILEHWQEISDDASEKGTEMHESIEMFYNNMYDPDLPRFQTLEFSYFLEFHRDYVIARDLLPFRSELVMGLPDAELCGMIDMLFQSREARDDPSRKHELIMLDWKRAKNIDNAAFNKDERGEPPLHVLDNSDYSHYKCQLNGYKYIIEQCTDYRITEMYLGVFHPDFDSYKLKVVPNLQREIAVCIRQRRVAYIRKYMDAIDSAVQSQKMISGDGDLLLWKSNAHILAKSAEALVPLVSWFAEREDISNCLQKMSALVRKQKLEKTTNSREYWQLQACDLARAFEELRPLIVPVLETEDKTIRRDMIPPAFATFTIL